MADYCKAVQRLVYPVDRLRGTIDDTDLVAFMAKNRGQVETNLAGSDNNSLQGTPS